jgi:hypothetical protein
MKYVVRSYGDEQLSALSPAQREALGQECMASAVALRASGQLLAAAKLQDSGATATVRVSDGELTIAAGPLGPAQEQLLGVFLIAAADLNHVVQIVARMPQLRCGPIEVRPVSEEEGCA